MPVSAGTRLGPYEIIAPLGAGGMGEVYRARDTRLGREVALKVLPAGFSHDAVYRARFEQEARAAAALSHPNIVGVHDIGNDGDVFYIVTELVAGETLAALIERGPVSTRKLLDIAVQIADGMAGAHAAGIAHRDLKPANIMIATDGRAKILDFGLAKQSALGTAIHGETVTLHQTEPGMIVGTVNYMSPEQARGQIVDYRSDQFSFGLILYEMATGKKAFNKPESVQTMSAILTEEPLPIERTIPAPLRWAIDRCLAKDPGGRYDSSRDLFHDLRNLRDHLPELSTTHERQPIAPTRRKHWRLNLAAVALVLITALGTALFLTRPQMADQSAYRFTPFSFEPGGQGSPVWSPDSKAVAYGARSANGPYQVFIRYLDSATPVQLTHGADDAYPDAWTPDGKRILFHSFRKPFGFWSISTVGGEPQFLMPLANEVYSTDFSLDGKAAAMFQKDPDNRYGIWVSAPPGSPPTMYSPDPFASREIYNSPRLRFSPDGKQILLLLKGDRHGEEAWLMPYPANSSQPPRLVLRDLPTYGGTPRFSWMPDSRHIVISLYTHLGATGQLWIADPASGERHALTSGTGSQDSPVVSPDGRKIIFTGITGNYDIVSVDLKNAAIHNLIATERSELMPAWAAKLPLLVYTTDRNGPLEIWLHSSGNGDRPVVTARDFPPETTQWLMGPTLSPDGDRVVYTRVETLGAAHLWISAASGGAAIQLTNETAATEYPGSWSPDGAWYTYVGVRGGSNDLMKVKTIGQATPVLLKAKVQTNVPSWSPTSEWIAYNDHGSKLMSPDGTTSKSLGDLHTPCLMFSADGKLVYGLRDDRDRLLLFSVDIATGSEKIIGDVGKDFRPGSNLNPAVRFSLAPDGKSFVYGTGKFKSNLWMLEGFAPKTGLLARLGFR